MAAQEDIVSVAGQLATLTLTVDEMAKQLAALRGRADTQQGAGRYPEKNASTSQPASSPR